MGTTTPIHDTLAGLPGVTPAPRPRPQPRTVTDDAERIVALAWREAEERGHGSFGTGHLLLGLVRAEGPEAGLLAVVGVTGATAGAAMSLVASSSVSEPVARDGGGPVAGPAVAEVLAGAAVDGTVTASGLLTALLARPWGQAAEMLAALGVEPAELAAAGAMLAGRPPRTPRPSPRDPSGLLSSAWRRPVTGA
ncbi:Clp protease N-terminal domain-containing protein [Actinomycetospora sp. C-140]